MLALRFLPCNCASGTLPLSEFIGFTSPFVSELLRCASSPSLCIALQSFVVNVEAEATVADLKKKIHETKGAAFEPALLKLVHAGKILVDDSTLTGAGVKDGGFVVCMVSKAKVRSSLQLRRARGRCRCTAPESAARMRIFNAPR